MKQAYTITSTYVPLKSQPTSFTIRLVTVWFTVILLFWSCFFSYAADNQQVIQSKSLSPSAVSEEGLIYGFVKNGSIPVAGAIVELTLNYKDSGHQWKQIKATTDATGKYAFNNTDVSGYAQFGSLQLNTWDNNDVTYFPASYLNKNIGTTPVAYNFNTQQNPVPTYSIAGKTVTNASTAIAGVTVTLLDASGKLVDTKTSDTNGNFSFVYITSGIAYTLKGAKLGYRFTTNSTGILSADVADKNLIGTEVPLISISGQTLAEDGSVMTSVTVTLVDDSGIVVATTTSDASGNFSFSNITSGISYKLKAAKPKFIFNTLDLGVVQTNLTNKNLVGQPKPCDKIPLPSKVILGYAHSWENASAPFLTFKEIGDKTKYNVVVYSFIETVNGDGYTPVLTINTPRYQSGGAFSEQMLIDDIAYLRNKGIPVIVSIGGQNGHVSLDTEQKKNVFVQGLINIVDKYGFDGIDLDFEGTSMQFGAGATPDFTYASISAYPKLKNVVDAFKEIKQYYGNCFILTCAPETFYVQVGFTVYNSNAGTFLPVMENLRNELDLIMVQLYNTGSVYGLDHVAYAQGTANFLTSMTDMLFTGFKGGNRVFTGFPASKLLVGIPSCSDAAPAGGYTTPTEVKKALNYMRYGTKYPGNYNLRNGNIDLRGVMTWSINWDVSPNCGVANEFGDTYYDYFYPSTSTKENIDNSKVVLYPNPVENMLNIDRATDKISELLVRDITGKLVLFVQNPGSAIDVSALPKGVYVVEIKVNENECIYNKIFKK